MDIRNEIEFWTQIMSDHGEFLYNSLAPTEIEAINTAQYFTNLFERIHSQAITDQMPVSSLISDSRAALTQFINFKRYLLSSLMSCNIKLGMTPTFLNHMINEALEFLHVLNLSDGTIHSNNVIENLRLHNVWLPDASGHASFIAGEMDPVESEFINTANEFSRKFSNMSKKSYSMYTMYERTRLNNSELHHFNEQVINTLTEFIGFLESVEDLRDTCSIFSSGTFVPLVPNHMMREEGYYIYKINEIGERFG